MNLAWSRLKSGMAGAMKGVEMATLVTAGQAFVDVMAEGVVRGEMGDGAGVAKICQLKNFTTTNMETVASAAVQIMGGSGCVAVGVGWGS